MSEFIWPTSGAITQDFSLTHPGIDIGAQSGTSVVAAGPGKIFKEGYWGSGGKTIQIDHGNGLVSQYMHLSEYTQPIGAQVSAGQQIGLSGASGIVTGPHLHFEINLHGTAIDPLPLLTGNPRVSISNSPLTKDQQDAINSGALGVKVGTRDNPFSRFSDKIDSIINNTPIVGAGKAIVGSGQMISNIGSFVTDSSNWKRVGRGVLGASFLLIGAIELFSSSSTVGTIAKAVK